MIPVVFSPKAAAFIRREAPYYREVVKKPALAKVFRKQMKGAARMLSEHPESGTIGLIPDTRVLVANRIYLVHYIIDPSPRGEPREIRIFAIRSARQGDAREPWGNI